MKHALTARYRPAVIGPAVVVTLTAAFAVLTLTRGLSWMADHNPDTVGSVLGDTAFGLAGWGAILTAGALLLLASLAARRHFAVWASHALLASAYVGITLAIGKAVLATGSGAAFLVAPIGGVIWHTFLNWRMKPVTRPHISEAAHGRRTRR